MTILPIEVISEIDQPIFGPNLLNLGKLKRNGFTIAAGLAVSPPEIILSTVLKHLQTHDKEIFEQKLTIIKQELVKIPLPEELEKQLGKHKSFFIAGKVVKNKKQLWLTLLGLWLGEIRSKIWHEGFTLDAASGLEAQAVSFVDKISAQISSFYDPESEDVMIDCPQKLEPRILKEIDEIVMSANKKLFLPQIYKFIISSNKLYLVELIPYTQTLPVSKIPEVVIPQKQQIIKSAVKIFVNLSTGFSVEDTMDGVLIEGEKLADFEKIVFKLCDCALNFPTKPIIFKLPDICDSEKIRGTLRILNQKSLLDSACEILLFVRNKKHLYNIELAIPYIRSSSELLQIKKELAIRDITRKGILKFWLEMAVPENLLNLDDYLTLGIDGVVLNLDELQKFLGGYDFSEGEFYKKDVLAVIKFITPHFKILHQNKIPVLAKGSLCIHPDMLDFLVGAGVWGIVANTAIEAEGLPEHLNWAEKRMVMKRLG